MHPCLGATIELNHWQSSAQGPTGWLSYDWAAQEPWRDTKTAATPEAPRPWSRSGGLAPGVDESLSSQMPKSA